MLSSCSVPPRIETLQLLALGTVFDISVVAPAAGWRARAEPALLGALKPWERDMYPWRDGELARANAAFAARECIEPSALLRTLIDLAREFETRHRDRFVPALADLTTLWRLHELGTQDWQPPDPARVTAAMTPPPRVANLSADGNRICAIGPVALDFGGFAKGMVIDELLGILTQLGHRNVIVNVGGDLMVRGTRDGAPWRVAVRDPHQPGAFASIAARDGEAIFTSGDYARHIDYAGRRYGHVLDPASGQPLSGIASVTVIGTQASTTDAATTALYVAAARARQRPSGLASLPAVADAAAFLIIDAHGRAWLNTAMKQRLNWVSKPREVTVLAPPPASGA